MNCFWSFLTPNDRYIFCEEQLCAMIVEPANTWSNIGYLVAALLILSSKDVTNRRVKHLFALATFALFIGSTLFHASATQLGHMADVSTMFFVSSVILTLSAERFFGLRESRANVFFAGLLSASLFSLFYFGSGSKFFALQIVTATLLEWRMSRGPQALIGRRVGFAVLLVLSAFLFWILDVKKILCDPGNHILTGHALWHLLAAGAIWAFFRSYAGIAQLNPRRLP